MRVWWPWVVLWVACLCAAFALSGASTALSGTGYPKGTPCRDRVIHRYASSRCSAAALWLLRAQPPAVRHGRYWHVYRGRSHKEYTAAAGRATRLLKHRLGYRKSDEDRLFGPRLWRYVQGRISRPLSYRVRAARRLAAWQRDRRRAHPPVTQRQHALVSNAYALIRLAPWIYYTQGSHRNDLAVRSRPPSPGGSYGADCSAAVEAIYHYSGVSTGDPGWIGWGGSLINHGRKVWYGGQSISQLHAGDVVIYRSPSFPGYPYGHTAMYIGGGLVFSHGGDSGPLRLGLYYRTGSYGPVFALRFLG